MDSGVSEEHFVRVLAGLDKDHGVRLARHLVDNVSPGDSAGRIATENRLAVYFGSLYQRTGEIVYLDEAIRLTRDALEASSLDSPRRVWLLINLAGHLGYRYERNRAIVDLEEESQLLQTAIDSAPLNNPDRHAQLSNLATHYGRRHLRTQSIKDLQEAIKIGQEAVDISPADHPSRAEYLNNLATSLNTLWTETQDDNDIEKAAKTSQEAVDATAIADPKRAHRLHNLSVILSRRYAITAEMTDLERAIQMSEEAVKKTPSEHTRQADYLLGLGNLFRIRHSQIGNDADLEMAISHLRAASTHATSPIRLRILAGRYLSICHGAALDWEEAYASSLAAVHLIPLLTPRSLGNSDVQHILGEIAGVASDAAALAVLAKKDPFSAVEMLEIGRSVLVGSLEEIRIDLLDLNRKHPELAKRFTILRGQLESPSNSSSSTATEDDKAPRKPHVDARREANQRLDDLLIEIRKQAGFERFMLPLSQAEIQAAAADGPIVFLNTSFYCCNAFIVEQHQIRTVPLPRLDPTTIQDKWNQLSLELPRTLKWLWDVVAGPVLDALGLTQPPLDDQWPYIWWIPTGLLSKFPIHAAGHHAKGSFQTVLDRVVSSYGSSVKTIAKGQRGGIFTASTSNKALLVAMPDTPGQRPLPFATKEVEMLRHLCKSAAMEPLEPLPRKQDVLKDLNACQLFHFAGHGKTSENDPLRSALLLKDWESDPLTVEDLLQTNLQLRSPFLAFLSACGTGRIKDARRLDEGLHLISACQLAGFRHVVGTLWEVNDETCREMSRITYEGIRDGGMTDESVRRGLHQACRELRDRWLDSVAEGRAGATRPDRSDQHESAPGHGGVRAGKEVPRDADPSDDDEPALLNGGPLHWVPYVHFGV